MIECSRKLQEMFRLHKRLNVEDTSVRLWRVSGGFFPLLFSFTPAVPEAELITGCGLLVEEQSSGSNWLIFAIIIPGRSDTGRQEEPVRERRWCLQSHSSLAQELSRPLFPKSSSTPNCLLAQENQLPRFYLEFTLN